MARFLISPGVITREIDQSQYTATGGGGGNIAAVVGYAERGPFAPTIVSGIQDFNNTYGYTLSDSPYLAQAAYNYFEQGDRLLVVRAGDNRDPDIYPEAAQYASKSIRVAPFTLDESGATEGYQAFSADTDLAAGEFTPSTSYKFRILADHRGFEETKSVETFAGLAAETSNTLTGDPGSPATTTTSTIFKAAFPSGSSTGSFIGHYKRQHSSGSTSEYYSENCSRSGTSLGSAVTGTLRKYNTNGDFSQDNDDFITLTGAHRACVMGTSEFSTGIDFSGGYSFDVTVNELTETIELTDTCVDINAVITHINAKLADAGLDSYLEAFSMTPSVGQSYIFMKHLSGGTGFTLEGGSTGTSVLSMFGWSPQTYNDSDYIVGTWYAEWPGQTPTATFEGDFAFKSKGTVAATSFEDTIEVSINAPASGAWTKSDIISKINAELEDAYDGTHGTGNDWKGSPLTYSYAEARCSATLDSSGKIRIVSDDVATEDHSSFVSISAPADGASLIELLGGTDAAIAGIAGVPEAGESLITLRAKEKGSYGNNLVFRTETEIVNYGLTSETRYNVSVFWNGKEVSVYRKVDWEDSTSSNYVLTKLAADQYIVIEAEDEDENSTFTKLPDGNWVLGTGDLPDDVTAEQAEITDFTVGTNGWILSGDTITSMSSDYMNAIQQIYNPEVFEFNLIFAPGGADPVIQNAVQAICNSRRDCFGIIDAAPLGLGLGVQEGTNDITEVNSACSTLTSSYVAAFWPWLQDYDADNSQYVWLPPSIYALKQMKYTDNIADPWWAPAGLTRGRVDALDVEYSPTRLDRDVLYGDTAIVNPIVKFINEGITIWGQKTAQRTLTATNRINVRRLLIYAEKLVARMARGFLFEPNDTSNYAAFTRQANAILEPIRQRRGLQTYQVICDASTNPPEIVDQNIMVGKIFVQPTKTIEFIEVEFTILPSGEVEINE